MKRSIFDGGDTDRAGSAIGGAVGGAVGGDTDDKEMGATSEVRATE